MDVIKQLDFSLKAIKNENGRILQSRLIFLLKEKESKITLEKIEQLALLLVNDDFVIIEDIIGEGIYYTFKTKGLLFTKKGGYRRQILENNRAERRVRITQTLTWILAVGVIPPFCWYSLDVAKLYFPCYLDILRHFVLPYGIGVFLLWLIYLLLKWLLLMLKYML